MTLNIVLLAICLVTISQNRSKDRISRNSVRVSWVVVFDPVVIFLCDFVCGGFSFFHRVLADLMICVFVDFFGA